jgi:bifunctional UDP-N-acetylglucosamine pyrophosphorylase/glucosamine-1-phosphate N-acetyltransferase
MKSDLPKVLHPVAGSPMVEYVLRTAAALEPTTTTLVVGHMAESVERFVAGRPGVATVRQTPQLGTGHALLQTRSVLQQASGTLLVLSGDVPLLTVSTLARLREAHEAAGAALTVLSAVVPDPTGYGRVIRDGDSVARIVEHRDATEAERGVDEINSGIYALDLSPLFGGLDRIGTSNAQGEYYLPDLVGIYRRQGLEVRAVETDRPAEVLGVNTRAELASLGQELYRERCQALMREGVTIVDPATTYVGCDVTVGRDTVLHPGVTLEGRTAIGRACEVRSGVRLTDATLEDRALVNDHSVVVSSVIRAGAIVGPLAHLRPGSDVGEGAHVGNFVELKKTRLGPGSKANHLSYLGDATIGARVNVGAGTITCNYDGSRKSPTIIEDEVFVGSDSQLVAPVRLGKGAYVAAGSSITSDVPPGALAIGRARQENKEGWVERARRRRQG